MPPAGILPSRIDRVFNLHNRSGRGYLVDALPRALFFSGGRRSRSFEELPLGISAPSSGARALEASTLIVSRLRRSRLRGA